MAYGAPPLITAARRKETPMRILLIEDDPSLSYSLSFQLKGEGFLVDTCENGCEALSQIREQAHDLLLLDWMLPDMDGLALLKKIRRDENPVPVIMLTALGQLQDKVAGLDAGADDYLVKPFAFEELMARIRSIARRPRRWQKGMSLSCRDLIYDPDEKRLTGPGGSCGLSRREGSLLACFLQNENQVLTRNALLARVWGPDAAVEDGNLDNYIHFLRRRLRAVDSCLSLRTVRGVGYRLEVFHE